MIIEYANPTTVKVTWPLYDLATHDEIIKRLSRVPGSEAGRGRCYWCPMLQVARLMDLFPKASYDYAAIAAADCTARTFFDSMVRMGVQLVLDASGAVRAVGQSISPLVQSLIDDRAPALRPLVLEAMEQPPVQLTARAQRVPVTEQEHKWGSWMAGVKNAAKKEEEAEKFKYPRRRRRAKKESVGT